MKRLKLYVISIVALTVILFGCAKNRDTLNYLTVKGSDTMVHLAGSWAEDFMVINKNADVSVTGGGSGTGIAALLNGTTDVCIASREIKEKEVKQAQEAGIIPKEIVVARDGIAVVVNPANPVSVLSVEQLGKIYTGAYSSWKEVGGPDEKIVVLSRESSSGTYVFFQERVMNKADYSKNALLMPATSSIIQSVSQDKWAIGYVGLGYALEAGVRVKMLAVKDNEDSQEVMPSVDVVKSGEYPISRPLYFYTNGEPKGIVKTFIDFCLSAPGQKIVLETGYVPN